MSENHFLKTTPPATSQSVSQTTLDQYYGPKGMPSQYLGVDVETTGFKRDWDLIVELGHCVMRNGQPVQVVSTLLDWTRSKHVDQDWLEKKLIQVRHNIEGDPERPTGRKWPITFERLRDEGQSPRKVLKFYRQLFEMIRDEGGLYVMHNGWQCDVKFLEAAFEEWINDPFVFAPHEVIDTGALVKAAQMHLRPKAEESMKDYFLRVVRAAAPGVLWSLDGFCLEAYGLDKKYELTREDIHAAGMDAYAACCLLEELRAGEHPQPRKPTSKKPRKRR